jgi:hypothetical protein
MDLAVGESPRKEATTGRRKTQAIRKTMAAKINPAAPHHETGEMDLLEVQSVQVVDLLEERPGIARRIELRLGQTEDEGVVAFDHREVAFWGKGR